MPSAAMQTKAELVDKVISHIRQKLAAEQAEQVESFSHQYHRWVAPDDLLTRDPLDIYGAALAHWRLAGLRTPGTAKVRVYTPEFDLHGWQSPHSVVEIVTDDMPFLVDSVTMELSRQGWGIHFVFHPVMRVRRAASGQLVEVLSDDSPLASSALAEAFIHVEIDRQTENSAELRHHLERTLREVAMAVNDFPRMKAKVREIVADLDRSRPPVSADELSEAKALLEWIEDNHFTFLGYREYDLVTEGGQDLLRGVAGSGLGILHDSVSKPHSFVTLRPEALRIARDKHLLILTKTNSRATVHRPAYMDYVGLRRFDQSGEVTGERRFLGLYTASAYRAGPHDIPVLRRKVQAVVQRAGFPRGHSRKALLDILANYPRDELFQISDDEFFETAMGILHLGERQRLRLFLRCDPFGRFVSCLVFLPRERYNTDTRKRLQDILTETLNGTSSEYTAHLTNSVLARLHFVIRTHPGDFGGYDAEAIEGRLKEAVRTFTEDLAEALVEQCGEEMGSRLLRKYADAFPAGYRDEFVARTAISDIKRIEALGTGDDLGMYLYRVLEAPEGLLRFKVFRSGTSLVLSTALPILENMGVTVVDERPHEVKPAGIEPVWIYDFGLRYGGLGELETDQVRDAFQEAFAKTWRGETENDGFNRLVLRAHLTARQITIVRAYCKYLRQIGTTFSQAYMEQSLADNPAIARLLVQLFEVRFDPARRAGAETETRSLVRQIEEALDRVESLDEDRILRSFLNLVQATLRTNYFQKTAAQVAKPYLSFKLNPAMVADMPLPRPLYEIFVNSPRMEGIHLRGGKVARGGIRWSDRREDFRTEILGLMKAQMVKNAVIVPLGAKGGFVIKQPPTGSRDALMEEVVFCYQTLIRGMLDLTDNIHGGGIIPPADLIPYDGDDPYLVVAADKGTATFSDIANAIAKEYGFWLGDGFASGGSSGYDHKKIAITARGAWESVKRHFRELGLDVRSGAFTVIGIGDMSGDLFGNGMLQSPHIRLVAAFDHRHIFLDPNPEPIASFTERARLFALPRSSWVDYNHTLISTGGGIFPRSAKSISISPEARQLLGIDASTLAPNELIRAILKAPADLLYNGGIGTYVKARSEAHADAGDRANDAIRINASELRCRVVTEGGNLGFTQRARVEYALGGGRIQTDALDNCAGVDCSDHEVNIKILLDPIVADGDLTEKQRNVLLAAMTDEVAELVLRDNFEQTQALAISRSQTAALLEVHARFIRRLAQAGKLNREIEFLPGDDAILERQAVKAGLRVPEMAVLLAYTKITLYDEMLASDLPDDPYLGVELERYFPAPLRERFREQIHSHRLRREIIATRVVNSMVNWADMTLTFRLGEETGASPADIARAYIAAREIFRIRDVWAEIESLGHRVSAETQTAMILRSSILVERATRWLLRGRRRPLDIASTIAFFAPGGSGARRAHPGPVGPGRARPPRTAGLCAGWRRRPRSARWAHRKHGRDALNVRHRRGGKLCGPERRDRRRGLLLAWPPAQTPLAARAHRRA